MKYATVATMFCVGCLLSGCVIPQQAGDDRISVAAVQKDIKIGMSSDEVVSILGAPNLVTTDSQRRESWIYDKVSTDTVYAHASGGAGLFGAASHLLGAAGLSGSSGRSSTNQRTLTIIIKFDNENKVRDYSYRQSSF